MTCGAWKMLMWRVGCSDLSRLQRSPRELRLERVLELCGSTMCSVKERRALCFSALTLDWRSTTASTMKTLGWSAQVSLIDLVWDSLSLTLLFSLPPSFLCPFFSPPPLSLPPPHEFSPSSSSRLGCLPQFWHVPWWLCYQSQHFRSMGAGYTAGHHMWQGLPTPLWKHSSPVQWFRRLGPWVSRVQT